MIFEVKVNLHKAHRWFAWKPVLTRHQQRYDDGVHYSYVWLGFVERQLISQNGLSAFTYKRLDK